MLNDQWKSDPLVALTPHQRALKFGHWCFIGPWSLNIDHSLGRRKFLRFSHKTSCVSALVC